MSETLYESELTFIGERSEIHGKVVFTENCKVFGKVVGEVHAVEGSVLVLAESAHVEGDVVADSLYIAGYLKGKARASKRLILQGTGRVIGDLEASELQIEPGAYFDGRAKVTAAPEDPSPSETADS